MPVAPKTGKAGFTLIELLVVVSIIGMLASIVLAATAKTRFSAKVVSMKKEMQQLVLTAQLYYDSNGGRWGGDLQHSFGTCPNTGLNGQPTMFAYADMRQQLNAISALFPGSTLECMAVTDIFPFTSGPAKYWTIKLTVPGYSGGTNRWCMDNYDPANGLTRAIGLSGSYNTSVTMSGPTPVVIYCGETGSGNYGTPYNSPDW